MLQLAGTDIEQFLRSDNFIAALAIIGGLVVALVGTIGATVSGILKSRAREQTRREVAAYVAEGTLDPDKAIEILNAGSAGAIARQVGALGVKTCCKS
jgi:hypothetical protein